MKPSIAAVILAVVAAGIGGAPAPAHAQGAQGSDKPACGVRIAGIDEVLRHRIQKEIAAQGLCGGELEVWISTSEQGVVVVARDPLGRTRTRVVLTIDVVASLLASWVAVDDSARADAADDEPAPAPAAPVLEPEPALAPAPPPPAPAAAAMIAPTAAPAVITPAESPQLTTAAPAPAPAPASAARAPESWSFAGGLTGSFLGNPYAAPKARLEIEFTPSRWRGGVASDAWNRAGDPAWNGSEFKLQNTSGFDMLGTARRVVLASDGGALQVLAGAALGLTIVDEKWMRFDVSSETAYQMVRAEASIAVDHTLGAHWAIEARASLGAPMLRSGTIAAPPYSIIYDGGLTVMVRHQ
jgi:hypothetical protein